MAKKHVYSVGVKIVERYSSTVLVEAESAAQAQELLEKDYNNGAYVYDKTTECADDRVLTLTHPRIVPPGEVHGALRRHINLNVEW